MNHRSRALTLCILLASCAGGGASLPAQHGPPKNAQTAQTTVTVVVPQRTQAVKRAPRYVSPSTKSMTVTVGPVGGPVSARSTVDCSSTSCTTTVDSPIGNDAFTVNLYDATGGTGHVLSTGSTTFTVVQGQLNLVSLTFDGVPAAVKMSLSPSTFLRGTASTAQLTVTEVDADNNIIVGPPAAYPSPITLSSSDTTGAVTLSTTQVSSSSQPPVTVSYNGSSSAPATVTFSASASGIDASNIQSAVLSISSGTLLYAGVNDVVDQLLVSNGVIQSSLGHFSCCGIGAYATGVSVDPAGTIYKIYPSATEAYSRDRSKQQRTLPLGGLPEPDGAGNLYVPTSNGVSVYAPGATQSSPPLRTLNVPGGALPDAAGYTYAYESSARIAVYAPNSSGPVAPVRSLLAANGISFYGPMATDTSRNLYVSGLLFAQPAVLVYGPSAQGAATPIRTISGSNTTLGADVPLAVDAGGYLYTWGSNGLITFAPGASGNVAPLSTFAESAGRSAQLDGLAVDPNAITSAGPPQGGGSPAVVSFRQSLLQNATTQGPAHLAAGPDGNVWFTYPLQNRIGKVTPAGVVTLYTLPLPVTTPTWITAGPDGAVWAVAEVTSNQKTDTVLVRTTAAGAMTVYPLHPGCCATAGLTQGPDGNLWFTDTGVVGKVTMAGAVTTYPAPGVQPHEITGGPDGNVWAFYDGGVTKVTPSGNYTVYPAPVSQAARTIAAGPDGKVWFTSTGGIAKIDPASGTVTPTSYDQLYTQFTFGTDGSVYTSRISKFSQAGQIFWDVLPQAGNVYEIITGPDGNIWFLQFYNDGTAFGAAAVTVMIVH